MSPYNPLSLDEDFCFPLGIQHPKHWTQIEEQRMSIDYDTNYVREKLVRALGIPQKFLGLEK